LFPDFRINALRWSDPDLGAAKLLPNAEFIPEWKAGAALETAKERVREFLAKHMPASA